MVEDVANSVSSLEPISLLAGAALGAIISSWLHYFLGRPKLRQTGAGSGLYTHLVLQNEPGHFGLRFGPTIVLGRPLLRDWKLGIPFDRAPARDCFAQITDKETGQVVAPLYWRKDGNFHHRITIGPGESADLIVFTRHAATEGKYYVWRPGPNNEVTPSPNQSDIQLEGTREFFVDVYFAHGARVKRFKCKVIRQLDGKYAFEYETGRMGIS